MGPPSPSVPRITGGAGIRRQLACPAWSCQARGRRATLRLVRLSPLLLVVLSACGAAQVAPSDAPSTACRAACAEAASAWARVADDAERANEASPAAPNDADRVLDRLERHVAELERAPREVSGEEAFALSSAVMDAVDAMGDAVPATLRDRVDDAAEALLTSRTQEGSTRAARDAAQVLEQAVRTARPGSIEDRGRRRALDALGRRAREAAAAYREEGAAAGDTRADRAESAAVPEGAPEALVEARSRATAASSAVRRDCRIARRISVPSL